MHGIESHIITGIGNLIEIAEGKTATIYLIEYSVVWVAVCAINNIFYVVIGVWVE
jgi:hypothetical protein